MKIRNVWVLIGSILVVVGFCLGWFGLRGFGGGFFIDGWQVVAFAKERGAHYYLLYLLPIGALGAAALACVNRRAAGTLAALVGGGFLLWGGVEIVRVLYHTTFAGLWLTVLGALVLLVAGVETRARA